MYICAMRYTAQPVLPVQTLDTENVNKQKH